MRHTHEIEVFLEAYRLRSFASAATALHATQSGVSQCIKRLEMEIGFKLFDRRTNTIEPKIAGRRFFDHCCELMSGHKAIISELQQRPGIEANLVVGVNAWMARFIVPSAIDQFSRKFPNVQLTVIEAASKELADLVARSRIAIAIASGQVLGSDKDTFLKTPGVLVSRSRIDLGRNDKAIDIIVPSASDPNREIIDRYLDRGVIPLGRTMELDSLSAAFSLLRVSDWAMILPEVVYLSEPDTSKLRAVALNDAPEFRLCVVYKRGIICAEARDFVGLVRWQIERVHLQRERGE